MHHFAASFHRGKAGKFYDKYKPEPKCCQYFASVLKDRYAEQTINQSSLLLKYLTINQQKNEKTTDYIKDMYKMAEEASMDNKVSHTNFY